jgi:RNA polymerase sigma-70 factor, ECF subfamily
MPATDRSLATRARAGDAAAFGLLLDRHRARVVRACTRALGDPAAAADVAQDAALVAWLQIARLRDPARFGAWLDGIGRMLCLRALRERAAGREHLAAELPELAGDDHDDPAQRVLAAERRVELASAIGALPAGQRDAVVLFHLADLPQATVADRLDTGVGAVRTRLHKARAALRAQLEPDQESPMPETAAVPARIADVRRTPAGRHVVLLAAGDAELPVWIGAAEAEALAAGLHDVERPRPHAHALALALLDACGRKPALVRIARLDGGIFYAEVELDDGATVDARPSDALTIAVAAAVPIEVDPAVLDAASASLPDEYAADLAQAPAGGAEALAGELRDALAANAKELARLQRPA